MKQKEKTCIVQPAYKQPNFFLYGILWLVIVFANRIYGVKYDRAQLKAIRAIKGPALVVASHHGPLDFAFLTYAMYPKRLSIVTAANIYYKKGVQRLLKTIKSAIPKKQFTTDYSSVKSIRKMLDAGVSVVVYPEARYSLDGRQGRVSDSLYKLIKWLKVPVVTIKCNMSYQIRPRYVNDFRKGRVFVETAVALSAEECAALTSDEIKARLQPWLTYNDLAYQQQAKQCFKGKKGYAEGLPDLLYKCPKCGAEFAHKARGNHMECAVCGNTVEIDGYNVIKPAGKDSVCPSRIDYWYDYQYNELKKEIISNEDYSLTHKVKMSVSNDKDCCYTEVESGLLGLTKNGLVYRGAAYPEVRFRIPNPPALSIDLIDRIDVFADDDTIFRFLFTAPEKPIKLNIALEIIADNISD